MREVPGAAVTGEPETLQAPSGLWFSPTIRQGEALALHGFRGRPRWLSSRALSRARHPASSPEALLLRFCVMVLRKTLITVLRKDQYETLWTYSLPGESMCIGKKI